MRSIGLDHPRRRGPRRCGLVPLRRRHDGRPGERADRVGAAGASPDLGPLDDGRVRRHLGDRPLRLGPSRADAPGRGVVAWEARVMMSGRQLTPPVRDAGTGSFRPNPPARPLLPHDEAASSGPPSREGRADAALLDIGLPLHDPRAQPAEEAPHRRRPAAGPPLGWPASGPVASWGSFWSYLAIVHAFNEALARSEEPGVRRRFRDSRLLDAKRSGTGV